MKRLHDLRHTNATLALRGIQTKIVSKGVGRASTSITADVYQYVTPGTQAVDADTLGRLLSWH